MGLLAGIPIIGDLIDLGRTWIQGRNERAKIAQQAKADALKARLSAKQEWEIAALQGAGWKDEWLTILISIPLVACWIPQWQPWVVDGFTALQDTPEWFRYLVTVVFAATFGKKDLPKIVGALKYALKK